MLNKDGESHSMRTKRKVLFSLHKHLQCFADVFVTLTLGVLDRLPCCSGLVQGNKKGQFYRSTSTSSLCESLIHNFGFEDKKKIMVQII